MANIKSMQMWSSICTDRRLSIRKSMFGLKTTATYEPTQSVIDAKTFGYTPQDGNRLRRILESPSEKLKDAIGNFHPKAVPNGNYMLEACLSRDGQFAALLLLQFINMSYEPVTKVVLYEGTDAQLVCGLLE